MFRYGLSRRVGLWMGGQRWSRLGRSRRGMARYVVAVLSRRDKARPVQTWLWVVQLRPGGHVRIRRAMTSGV